MGAPSDHTPGYLKSVSLTKSAQKISLQLTPYFKKPAFLLFFAVLAIFCIQINPVYPNQSLRKSHKPGYFLQHHTHPGGHKKSA